MRSFPLPFAALFALVIALAAASGRAQAPVEESTVESTDHEARTLFERGNESYARGEYAEAKRLFEAAYHLSKRPQLLYNVALAADHLRQDEDALHGYRGYLEALPEASNRDEVRARIRVLEQALAAHAPAPEVAGPEEAAKTLVDPILMVNEQAEQREHKPLVRRWWVWTAVAVVLAGTAVGIAMATRDTDQERPLPGDNGLVVHALVQR